VHYPDFYDQSPALILYDPLADFLGALQGGEVTIRYLDCVKLAGHSCPTVAGAYRMAQAGLAALYPESLPRRSEMRVELSGAEEEGVVGVVGAVIGYITGAGGIGGFKGMAGIFARNDRLHYGADIAGDVRLSRIDTGASVILSYDPSSVPGDPRMKPLMQKALRGEATDEERALFARLWQDRTRTILLSSHPEQFVTITKG